MEIKNPIIQGILNFVPSEAESDGEKCIVVHSHSYAGVVHTYKLDPERVTELRDFLSAWLIKHNN